MYCITYRVVVPLLQPDGDFVQLTIKCHTAVSWMSPTMSSPHKWFLSNRVRHLGLNPFHLVLELNVQHCAPLGLSVVADQELDCVHVAVSQCLFNKLSCWRDHSEAGSHKFMLFTTHTHARARTLSQHTHKHTHEQVAKNVCSVLRIQQWKEKKLCPCRLMLRTKDKPTVSRTQQCSWTKNTFQSVSWVPFCGVNKSPRCLASKTGLLPGIVLLTLVRARLGETICYLSFPVSVADHTSVSN